MEELRFIEKELERIHLAYLIEVKAIWESNDILEAEKKVKKISSQYQSKKKLLEVAEAKIGSGLEELEYYKRGM